MKPTSVPASSPGAFPNAATVETRPEDVVRLLQRCRLDLSNEKALQEGVAQALLAARIPYEREKRLSDGDIPDFLVDGGIVIECKMRGKGRKVDIFKQIARYAAHGEVRAVILASNLTMGLPPTIEDKPIFAASLSQGWL